MTPSEHRRRALMTLSDKPARLGIKRVSHKRVTTDVFHACMGLSTEMGELLECYAPLFEGHPNFIAKVDNVNAVEEFGDLFYYLCVLARRLKVPLRLTGNKSKLNPWEGTPPVKLLLALHSEINGLLDQCKKVCYGRELNLEAMAPKVQQVMAIISVAHRLTGVKLPVILDTNIKKLAKRYPEGFFDAVAEGNRNKVKEVSIMKEAISS